MFEKEAKWQLLIWVVILGVLGLIAFVLPSLIGKP